MNYLTSGVGISDQPLVREKKLQSYLMPYINNKYGKTSLP